MKPSGTRRTSRAYWVTRAGRGELRAEPVPSHPEQGHSLIAAEFTGVSPGTERLVGLGRVPGSCAAQMACNYMAGDFSLPIKYGYNLVGTGVAGSLAGQRLFVMHPHQELAHVADAATTPLPDFLPSRRAVLIPNLETALNAVWDAEIAAAEGIVIVGEGVCGLLVAFVLERLHQARATIVELDARRLEFAQGLGWVHAALSPHELPRGESAVAFHTSASPAGLQLALDALGFEGRVIDMSWYGDRPVPLDLGTHFHYQRKRIIASQVGSIAPSRRTTCTYQDRLRQVVALLQGDELDPLLGSPVAFDEMPVFMNELYSGGVTPMLPVIAYRERRGV